ncbi:hypothetical protein [Klebsiella variicola]|uniref:hypothetical protein n=1 Tax=Klebsiella variicola TaxID=244366 RepID=UPI001FB4B716|nr:hypothetical protein [Klebsiella variicola]MCJ0887518.1 hypothetical protein [Klebsiella variicola]
MNMMISYQELVRTFPNTDNTGASDRLADVNVKLIAGIAITVFAVIIVAIMFYRQ